MLGLLGLLRVIRVVRDVPLQPPLLGMCVYVGLCGGVVSITCMWWRGSGVYRHIKTHKKCLEVFECDLS